MNSEGFRHRSDIGNLIFKQPYKLWVESSVTEKIDLKLNGWSIEKRPKLSFAYTVYPVIKKKQTQTSPAYEIKPAASTGCKFSYQRILCMTSRALSNLTSRHWARWSLALLVRFGSPLSLDLSIVSGLVSIDPGNRKHWFKKPVSDVFRFLLLVIYINIAALEPLWVLHGD